MSEVVETTEETVITDFSPSTVTVDLADVSASDPVRSLMVDSNDVMEIVFYYVWFNTNGYVNAS